MRRMLVLGLAALAAACQDTVAPDAQRQGAPDAPAFTLSTGESYVPGRVLARFRPGADGAAVAASAGATIERPLVLGIQLLRVPEGRELAVARALSRNPSVVYAEPDLIRTFGTAACESGSGSCLLPTDTYFGYKWDLHNDGTITTSSGTDEMATGQADADIDWLEAHDHLGAGYAGSAVVGIIDSGILPTHQDLSGKVTAMADFFGSTDGADDYGHGTHVAGIAAGSTNNGTGVSGVGYSPNITIVSAKVCGPTGWGPFASYGCPESAIVSGITWAVDNGASVLNLSLGGPSGSSAEQDALAYALAQGALPFCATGNDNSVVSYPAAFPECVAVAATDWGDGRASYSNFGPQTEIAAPGGDDEDPNSGRSYILSTCYDSTTTYCFMAGTSMATPQATGLGALLASLGLSAGEIRSTMQSTADDLGSAGRDDAFGYGRINAYQAVLAAAGGGSEPPPPPPPAGITLSANGYKSKGMQQVDLAWSGAASASVDVFRNGAKIATTANDGAHTDSTGQKGGGSYTYKVCEAGTSTCSNEATVSF